MKILNQIAILLLLFGNISAQVQKADKFFELGQYKQAISIYKKAYKKDSIDYHIIKRIAEAYSLLHSTEQAEIWYQKAIRQKESIPLDYFNYAQILKNNKKYQQAKEHFLAYYEKVPADIKGKMFAEACDSIAVWETQKMKYKLVNIGAINSTYSEFGSAYFQDGIVFASNKKADYLNNSSVENNNYLKLYNITFDQDALYNARFRKPKLFTKGLNGRYHHGPATFDKEQKLMFYAKTIPIRTEEKNNEFRWHLFFSDRKKSKWNNEQEFPYNDGAYSIVDPSLSPDGKTLYFASNMQGGYGGEDIYVCNYVNDSWAAPKNLGPQINTFGDEKFPFIHNSGWLYFSSDGHPGFGGLDIFTASKEGDNWQVCNMKLPFNSSKDDFGLIFDNGKSTGFLSSDRPGGVGGDDIYYFAKDLDFNCVSLYQDYCVTLTAAEDSNSPQGIFEWVFGIEENKIGKQVEHCYPGPGTYYVQLIVRAEETGEVLYQEKQIKIEIKEDENKNTKIDLFAKKEIRLRKTVKFDASGLIEGCDVYRYLWDMGDGSNLEGKAIIHRYDEVGEYRVALKMLGEGSACAQSCDTCIYKLITVYEDLMEITAEAIDTNIWIKGRITDKSHGEPITGLMVILESTDFVDMKETNDEGFYFFVVRPEVVYTLSTSSDDYFNINEQISTRGLASRPINRDLKLKKIELEVAIEIPNINYNVGGYKINSKIAKELDNVVSLLKANPKITIEISSHTDSKSSASSNQQLSERRAQEVVNYIISKGISSERLVAKGYGESKLLNHCADGIECTEEEHQRNRRTEFKVIDVR